MKNHREKGMALITALLVMMLISSLIIGITWLTISDQKLGYNYAGRQTDFYIAETGLETMTANLANKFNDNYNLSSADINGIMSQPPTLPYGYTFWDPNNTGNNGYVMSYTPDPNNNGNPLASYHTILSGPYAGLVGLLTPYTLEVTAESPLGSETKLRRTVQTAAIPVFQFGIFSQTDLSFFAGPDFDFGGRVHTNGNLWLAENGGTLTMENKVTAVKEVIRTNLENGYSTSSSYNTTVNITTNPGSSSYRALATTEGSTTGSSNYDAVSTSYTPNWATQVSVTDYNSNIGARETGVTPLNLGIATPALGGQPIDLIRRPLPADSSQKLAERYYSQASVRILLSDYGPDHSCASSDIMSLPEMSSGIPVDIATLAWDSTLGTNSTNTGDSSVNPPPYKTAPTSSPNTIGFSTFQSALTTSPAIIFPLPVSGATSSTTYSSTNGYWQQPGFPIESGCLKIDVQSIAGGSFTDVTWKVLSLGYSGRNIEPLNQGTTGNGWPAYVAPPTLPTWPATPAIYKGQGPTISTTSVVTCVDPSPNAVIRFARIRPNPTTAASGNGWCGNTSTSAPSTVHGSDFWPNVLFDTREGTLRDTGPTGANTGNPTPNGTMHYVELDVKNLAAWIVANNSIINNTTGYTVYFSDRRSESADPTPAPSVLGSPSGLTGGYGFDDIINSGSGTTGCPDGGFETAEDFEGDYNSNGVDTAPVLRTYGNPYFPLANMPANLWMYNIAGVMKGTQLQTTPSGLIAAVLAKNNQCGTTDNVKNWPFAVAGNMQDFQENPLLFFRRSLKLIDGAALASGSTGIMGTCDGVNCGLTIVAENPVYVQGDYNDANLDSTFASSSPHVACAVIGDAVTLLSDAWNDVNSFTYPYNPGNRARANTMYRMAIVSGKGIPFVQPSGTAADYGTDGGMHNFLRYLEGGSGTLYYHGSVVSFYFAHQATSTYKCCTTVYAAPTRAYKFDSDFETPSLLPPRTPMLRSINTLGFTQVILPTQ